MNNTHDAAPSHAATTESTEASEVRKVCEGRPKLSEDALGTVPETVVSFAHTSEPCEALGTGFLLRNTGAGPLRILGVAATPRAFQVVLDGEPGQTIAPGQTARAVLTHDGTLPVGDEIEGSVIVATDAGCTEVRVLGVSSDEALSTVSEGAIDFGVWAPGERSGVREVAVLYQRAPTFEFPSEYSNFAATPAEIFQVDRAPVSPVRPASCDSFSIALEFTPPSEAGSYEGGLTWRLTTDTPEGPAEALVHIPLFGRVE